MAVTILSQDGVPDPAALTDLAQRATRADGDPPFSDQTLVDVRSARAGLRSVIATEDGALVGVAVINPDSDQASTFTVELVVDPERRGAGIGTALVREVRGQVEGTVEAWGHGDHPGARRLAETYGLTAVRDLHRLRRQLRGSSDLPLPVDLTEDLEIRPFEPGRDENGWLRVNAQAFSDHPEQGKMTLDDLHQREAEEWFDAPGFLLAVRADDPEDIQGFHWTKIHPASDGSPAMGEVYAVGIAPEQQGRGLGKALTAAGVNYLADQDLENVMLYVDGDNTAAMALYEKLGFERWHLDVMFRGEITG
ncbi:mycothiol synthase [Kocuria sp. cx-455]|uniref:mycothiol synthase n=1 Tax=Kocuria sp. cx-455 TaxID=2771377 RepID=UPI00168A0C3A|nr:mycothiol synthase [Kocuria sp. cx-455]MBD2764281.1 mycothiol synthase [Kocuria sp. cx-455]